MFVGMESKKLEKIKKRLKAELIDKELPGQRREEVNSYLLYINQCIKAKREKPFNSRLR